MLKTRDFLVHELNNVEAALNEALRFDFGGSRSHQFYKECRKRLMLLRAAVDSGIDLPELIEKLSKLSELIARFERSHIGEFSWPFAYELEELALVACTGKPATRGLDPDDVSEPLFFFSSYGGLRSYSIHVEEPDPDSDATRSIFSVVFPRSLKHQVLLHPVLGHELGHAFYASIRQPIYFEVVAKLFRGTVFETVTKLRPWLKKNCSAFNQAIDDKTLSAIRLEWWQEIFCDIFGLLVFGPSFLPAMHTLFHAIDAEGRNPTPTHPPTLLRYHVLKVVWDELNWAKSIRRGSVKAGELFDEMVSRIDTEAGYDKKLSKLIPEANILAAKAILEKSLARPAGLLYKSANGAILADLVELVRAHIPPAASLAALQMDTAHKPINFRTILAAGWLACISESRADSAWLTLDDDPHNPQPIHQIKRKDRFYQINRLCDMAILQNRGIKIQIDGKQP